MDEQALIEILERLRNRFYGKYRGAVTNVDDPMNQGRIKAKVPAVLGAQETGWCMPCVPYAGNDVGFVFIPEVGSGVWIEFEGGDVSYPIWTGCYWRTDELPAEASPTVKTIKTQAENTLVLDDDESAITLQDANENTAMLDSTGITLSRGAGKIAINDTEVNVNDGAVEVM
jgi:uncharacterized protein involved in type VI secretion and phage assembly